MDPAGWVPVEAVLAALAITRAELERIVRENNKARLQLDGVRVRACQGHSLEGSPVTQEALEASWVVWEGTTSVWHGTTREALPGIARAGLLPQRRTHVHLADQPDSRVGKRSNTPVLLEVDPQRVRAAGSPIFQSPNGVLLVRAVPPGCLLGLRALSRSAQAEEGALRAVLGLG